MRKNTIHLRVNWGDTDKAGIVYYPNFFKWFDIAGHQFFRDCGLPPGELEEKYDVIVPLIDTQCTFKNPIYYDDIIAIHTEVEKLTNRTIKLRHVITRDEKIMGEGYEVRGWVKQMGTNIKAVPIPDEIRKVMEQSTHTTDEGRIPILNA